MKYIVIEKFDGLITRKYPIIFPSFLIHKDVAETMLNGVLKDGKVISGGDINSFDMPKPYGKTTSLKLPSRPQDEQLIKMCDYNGGLE